MSPPSAAKSKAVPFVRQTLKATSAAVDVVRRPERGITILIYHRVVCRCNGGQMDLSPDSFARQLSGLDSGLSGSSPWIRRRLNWPELRWASDAGGVGRRRRVGVRAGRSRVKRRATVERHPSGRRNHFRRRHHTDWSTAFCPLSTGFMCPQPSILQRRLSTRVRAVPPRWPTDELDCRDRTASSDLVTIGSHTHRHSLLDRLDGVQVGYELDRSIDLLQEHLGTTIEHFAHSKAVAGSIIAEAAVRERFRTAVLAGTRSNQPGADLHRLNRSPIQPSDGTRWFRRKTAGGMGFEDDLRQNINRVRYRGKTT
ncbi:MAG: polysaccharide deacetylase family protein [Microthrixaceae bacterium]